MFKPSIRVKLFWAIINVVDSGVSCVSVREFARQARVSINTAYKFWAMYEMDLGQYVWFGNKEYWIEGITAYGAKHLIIQLAGDRK